MKLPSGLLDQNVEIFRDTQFNAFCTVNGKVLPFKDFPDNLRNSLENDYNSDQLALAVLRSWFPDDENAQLERFTSCRYGAFCTENPDYIQDKEVLIPDFCYCPARKVCRGYGHVCLLPLCPDTNERLTKQELECLLLISSGLPDKALYESMGITNETFNEYKRRAFLKLNAHSKLEAINKAQEIIQI